MKEIEHANWFGQTKCSSITTVAVDEKDLARLFKAIKDSNLPEKGIEEENKMTQELQSILLEMVVKYGTKV